MFENNFHSDNNRKFMYFAETVGSHFLQFNTEADTHCTGTGELPHFIAGENS